MLVGIAQWILFMTVNTLVWRPSNKESEKPCSGPDRAENWAKHTAAVPNESFRILFRFIALGLGGLNL
jgi:hypothetical protein